jgi:DNA-binding NtrC family response regulator
MGTSSTLWIIHRNTPQRAALARIAGAGDNTILGAPSDELFTSASPANVVLLAPSGDFESELEFVHRFSSRLPGCTWIVLPTARDFAEARRLFDNLPVRFLRFPPQPDHLRRCIADAENRRSAGSLSRRRGRDLLEARFFRWFSGLNSPDLLRALDPKLCHLPLLIRGEEGTGRGLVARYVHAFGSSDASGLLHVPCAGVSSERELLELIGAAGPGRRHPSDGNFGGNDSGNDAGNEAGNYGEWHRTVWLEDVDRLPEALQLRVRGWIEYGLPEAVLRTTRVRFVASARDERDYGVLGDDSFDDQANLPRLNRGLAAALSGLVVALPSLRERAECIGSFVAEATRAWSTSQSERPRSFGDLALHELESYPWPGNMAQLEAVVHHTLSHSSADPLEPHHLRFNGDDQLIAESALPIAEFVDEDGGAGEIDAVVTPDEMLPAEPEALSTEPAAVDPNASEDLIPEDFVRPQKPVIWPEPSQLPESDEVDQAATGTRELDLAMPGFDEGGLRRLVGALAHEVRNPLVSIRTFSELLPDHYGDEEFRTRFAELVRADVLQIEKVVTRLQDLSELAPAHRVPIDLPSVLERLLDRHAGLIQERHLLVLKELDRNQPFVLADEMQLDRAFSGLFETAFSMVPERGDVYLASKHNAQGYAGAPIIRILLRYHNPSIGRPLSDLIEDDGFRIEGVTPPETALEFLIAEAIIKAQGGSMTIDSTDGQETVIVVDLPAAPD